MASSIKRKVIQLYEEHEKSIADTLKRQKNLSENELKMNNDFCQKIIESSDTKLFSKSGARIFQDYKNDIQKLKESQKCLQKEYDTKMDSFCKLTKKVFLPNH